MSMQMLRLKPGVNVETTPSQLEAGYATSQFIRFRNGLAEKLGGWAKLYQFAVGGVPKALHAWLDLSSNSWLAAGTTSTLAAIQDGVLSTITPQTYTSSVSPNFQTTASSTTVTIIDSNISNVTTLDSLEFKTPVAVGGIVLAGVYPIALVLGTHNYQITAASAATMTRANATITAVTRANPGAVTTFAAHGFSSGDLIYFYGIAGMTQLNGQLCTITSTGANTFTIGIDTSGYAAYSSAGTASPAAVPKFTTVSGNAAVTVALANHGLSVDSTINFPMSTTVGGVTVSGTYNVVSVGSANAFTISTATQASSSTSAFMNSGDCDIVYQIAIGPPQAATGYSVGTYSSGSYSTGSSISGQTGTALTAAGYSLDNWGEVLLACPDNGGLYAWRPGEGIQNAQYVPGAPPASAGMFISQATQMVICYGSSRYESIGYSQDSLLVTWCAQGDYTSWTESSTSQAGSRHLPNGSRCVAGMSVSTQELIWTDQDLWAMAYLGYPSAWGFTKIGANCGAIAKHAVCRQGSNVYWMGRTNFYYMSGGQPLPIPCTVWDTVFQDLNADYLDTCWAWSNTAFNEIWFFFPRNSTSATTPDYFVKYNTLLNIWDNGGPLDRGCGIDVSVLGMPVSATSSGIVYQHEVSPDADGQAIPSSFTTGIFALGDGIENMFVDWVIPDGKFGDYNASQSASLSLTFYSQYYIGGTTTTHGPYTYNASTTYLNPRVRGRAVSVKIESDDVGSFWRVGGLRTRSAPDGRFP